MYMGFEMLSALPDTGSATSHRDFGGIITGFRDRTEAACAAYNGCGWGEVRFRNVLFTFIRSLECVQSILLVGLRNCDCFINV